MERTITVELGPRSYDVRVAPGLLHAVGQVAAQLDAGAAVVISDSNVAPLYGKGVLDCLAEAGISATLIDFPAGEANKNLSTCGRLFDALFAITPAIDRDCLIVALGGGVTGDLAGLVAAAALRGLRWIQCPTSLLADVDASVGGKTGVDHPAGKNLIGAFHQPSSVLIDPDALKTLGPGEFRDGLSECVKHAIIRDAAKLEFLEDNAAEILSHDGEVMTELIAWNVQIKAGVVSADEKEAGERAHLNFGHTIAHAIEAQVGFGRISHGQAVALGMVAACHMAVLRGFIEQDSAQRVEDLLRQFDLPVSWDGLNADGIWDIMQHDKKARGGEVHMVLPVVIGQVAIFDDVTQEVTSDAVEYLGRS